MQKPLVSLFWKSLSCLLIGGLLLLGLIGLVLPVIPGILFLFLALLLATRVSRRAAAWAESHRWFTRHNRLWQRAGALSMTDRLRLGLLVAARSVVKGLQSLAGVLGRSLSRSKQPR